MAYIGRLILTGSLQTCCKCPRLHAPVKQSNLFLSRSLLPAVKHVALSTPWCRNFHTSRPRPAPPVVWVVVRAVAQAGSILGGRFFRKKWQKMSDKDKKVVKKCLWKNKYFLAAVAATAVFAVAIDYLTHLQSTPITHRKRYIAFTDDQFLKIANFEYLMHMENAKDKVVDPSHPVYKSLIKVTQHIINSNQDIDLLRKQKWTLIVVDSPEENAFVLPTGHIFVFTGIMKHLHSESQLAFMLSHELSHVILNHGAEKVSYFQLIDKLVILLLAGIWFFMPSDGIAIITQAFFKKVLDLALHLPYSRSLETEADEVGLQLTAKACYDVRDSSVFWNSMAIQSELPGEADEIPEWLSTHPNHENRADHLDGLIPGAIQLRALCKCFRLPEKDPRDQIPMLKKMAKDAVAT